jgi:hypothetical protein
MLAVALKNIGGAYLHSTYRTRIEEFYGPTLMLCYNLTQWTGLETHTMARRKKTQNNRNNRRHRYSGGRHIRYSGGRNGGNQEQAQSVSSIGAEAMRATADRIAENTMATADILHEQAEQFVGDLYQQSDFMARQFENFFG